MCKPNIVYMHSHDTGRYIQPYGYAVPTPNLQRLAEQGVLFRQNFCANPTCSPSRAALVTGTWPHQNGMFGLAHRGFSLHDYGQHMVHTLKSAGYQTALSGVQHVARDAAVIGYDHNLTPDRSHMPHDAACEFLNNAPAEPFFLAVGFGETHRAFPDPEPEDQEGYCRPPDCLPDTPETRKDMAGFKKVAARLDTKMGAVLDALDRNGLAENTLVICTTDHGIAFPRMKCNLTDDGIGVMLIVRGPGGFEGGRVSDALVSHIDIFPTVCDVAGVPRPRWLEGKSLVPLATGEQKDLHEAVFAEVNYHACYEPMRSVRTCRWKYIRHFGDRRRTVLPNCDAGHAKKLWMAYGWSDREHEQEQLFDLMFDPHEAHNCAQEPAAAGVLSEMRERLETWMRETRDPLLLQGWVEPPDGVEVNDPDDTEPFHPKRWVFTRHGKR